MNEERFQIDAQSKDEIMQDIMNEERFQIDAQSKDEIMQENPSQTMMAGKDSHEEPEKSTGKRAASSSDEDTAGPSKRPRRTRKTATEEEKREASALIQRWWKGHIAAGNITKKVIEDFFAKGISLQTAKDISFDELAARLREQGMLDVMTKTVLRVFYLSFGRRGTRRIAEANLNIRVFLAAYMITYRPTFVFESQNGALEKELKAASEPLLESFHRICEELQQKPIQKVARELTDDFPTKLHAYVKKFKAWKIPDENKLSERIKHALAALYQAESQLSADEPEGSRLRLEFQSQQERLRYKLMQVAGVKVLTDFDALRGRAHLPLPTAAAAAAAAAASSSSSASSAGGGSGGAGSSGNSNNMYSSLPGRMTNEQLAHELLLDPSFKLDDKGGSAVENPVFSRIRESFHVAFWDSLVDDLKLSPPCYVRVVRVLSEIRDGIADLASGTKEAAQINSVVDVEAIREQVEGGKLEWVACVGLVEGIVAVLQRMQAPKRDAETAAQWSSMQEVLVQAGEAVEERPAAFCKALELVLERVNTIRVDAANARLRMIAPVIKIHGVEYERAHMEKRLKAAAAAAAGGGDGEGSAAAGAAGAAGGRGGGLLERTEKWLGEAVRAQVAGSKVRLDSLREGKAEAFEAVHARAVLGLVMGAEAPSAEQCPETLMLDLHRLQAAHAEFHFGVLGATALVQLQQKKEAREALGEQLRPLAGFFASHTPRVSEPDLIHKELMKHLEQHEPAIAAAHKEMVAQVLEKSKHPDNPVRRIFGGPGGRMGQLWAAAASAAGMPETPPLPPVALLFPPRIKHHAQKIKAVTELNLKVHAAHYNKMIASHAKALAEELEQQQAAAVAANGGGGGDSAPGGPA